MRKAKLFAKEVDLCAAFIKAVGPDWTVFAETGGWDILLVRKRDGFQIGIEAKLRLNAEVINQALEEYAWNVTGPGPDCRAILVPEDATLGLSRLCAYVGLVVIKMHGAHRHRDRFAPRLPKVEDSHFSEWPEWAPTKRHPLPEYIPDVAAGAPAPIRLTQWKIGALRLQAIIEDKGFITREDFKMARVDHRRWVPSGWLEVKGGRYVKGTSFPDFAAQHPKVFEQIKQDMLEGKRKTEQGVLL